MAKRIYVYDILVHIYDDDGESKLIQETDKYNNPYHKMFEFPSWSILNTTGEINWCEFLMWENYENDRDEYIPYPLYNKLYLKNDRKK